MHFSVLIAEDTQTVAALIRIYLHSWSLVTRVARNGSEAFQMALAQKPDLVLSDCQMPGMDGFALCAAIRADPALQRVPVILLTSHDEETRQRGRLVGATDFLEKPLRMGELRNMVARLLRLDPDLGSPL